MLTRLTPALAVAVCILLALSSATAAPTPSLPFVVTACVRTHAPPVIDGKLDDACWQTTRPMMPFGKLTLGTPATEQSVGYLVYDSEKLYIGVHCDESRMNAIRTTVTERDGPTFKDDCIELFLIPPDSRVLTRFEERVRYFHLVINALGTRYDEIGLEAPQLFDGRWQASTWRGPDGWELEVAVPFAELGVRINDGAVWTGNISRARWVEKEYSSWAPIKRSFHDTANFGRIVFTTSLAATDGLIDRIEFEAVRSTILAPTLEEIGRHIGAAQQTIADLPDQCRPRVEKAARRLLGRLRNLQTRLESVTVDNFRSEWERLYGRADQVRYDASRLEDEAVMLAATDGGARPWQVFITETMTNDRMVSNRWPRGLQSLPQIGMTACRGEYESATFSVYATRDLQGVRLAIGDLTSGDTVLPASCIDPYVVKCWYQAGRGIGDLGHKLLTPELLLKDDELVRVDYREQRNFIRATPGSSDYLDATLKDSANLDALIPRDADELLPVDIPARTLKQFWLTAHIPADAAPGTYTGSLVLSAEGEAQAAVPIEITVPPFDLAEPMLEYSIYYRGKLSEDGRGTIASEWKSREQFAAEMRNMVAHGVTNPTIYQRFDERLLNQVFDLREAAGMRGKPVMTLGMSTGAPTTPEALDALKAKVKTLRDFITKRGYAELYVYGIDEASGDRLKAERAAFAAVHEAGAKVYVACYKGYFELVGDLLDMPIWSGRPNPEEAIKAHSVGHRIFSYGNPQCGVEEPETYRRNFGIALWKAGYDGAMDYAYQHSFGHEWNDFDNQSYRDHTMAYPTENGVIDTIQWEGFREAVDDIRYLTTLIEAVEAAETAGTKAHFVRATESWIERIDPDADLDALREEITRRIIQLDK